MRKVLRAVDRLSTFVGHFFAWAIVGLTGLITIEVFFRYVLDTPHAWVLDAQIMLYGVLFMMSGAYTLAAAGHVRGDVLYGFFPDRVQAAVDLVLYFVFFLPGIFALTYAGWSFATDSLAIHEQTFSPEPLPLYPFKFVIPVAGFFLLLQGLVEIARCVICLRDGAWPSRVEDVEEVDVEKLKEVVHVSDEDIARLDEIIATRDDKEPQP
ncbi:MAG TPA: TRAP transporter small permease subunit [Rhodocyclaceae bacterium]|nr:TRAP transporter small permease subunit [Rhodocyclaceae bacterium]